jgi:hypothetical protein
VANLLYAIWAALMLNTSFCKISAVRMGVDNHSDSELRQIYNHKDIAVVACPNIPRKRRTMSLNIFTRRASA